MLGKTSLFSHFVFGLVTNKSFGTILSPCLEMKNVTIVYDCLLYCDLFDIRFYNELFEHGCSNIWILENRREKAIQVRNMNEVREIAHLFEESSWYNFRSRTINHDLLNFLQGLLSSKIEGNKQLLVYFYTQGDNPWFTLFEEIKLLQTKKNYDVIFVCHVFSVNNRFCNWFKSWLPRHRYVQVSVGLNINKVVSDLIRNPDYDRYKELDDIRNDCCNSTRNIYVFLPQSHKYYLYEYEKPRDNITKDGNSSMRTKHAYSSNLGLRYDLIEHFQARYVDINFFWLYRFMEHYENNFVVEKFAIFNRSLSMSEIQFSKHIFKTTEVKDVKERFEKEKDSLIQIRFNIEFDDELWKWTPFNIGKIINVHPKNFDSLSQKDPDYEDYLSSPKMKDGKILVLTEDMLSSMFLNLLVKQINSILCKAN